MKEKLRKHQFSIVLAFVWTAAGALILGYTALSRYPFVSGEGTLILYTLPLLIGASVAYIITAIILARLRTHAFAVRPLVVNFTATIAAALLFMILAGFRVYFSLSFLLLYFIFTNFWFLAEYLLRSRFALYVFAVVPVGYRIRSERYRNIRLIHLEDSKTLPTGIDGIVVDFHQTLSDQWLYFVSRCVLNGIPVISADDFVETQDGVIILNNLTTAQSIAFQSITPYLYIKRLFDILLTVIAAPLWIPIIILAMIAVRLESRGKALFAQKRVGRYGRVFTMYKIRSMYADSERNGAAFADHGDSRITKVGAFLRKYRIDEFPQFINILRGEMSLIGPRPEQVSFVEEFEQSIPYYQLRHIVRPGLTGWAQIRQGYASGEAETADKLAFDLYYVKRLSFSLDFLIGVRTIATVLLGFGAR